MQKDLDNKYRSSLVYAFYGLGKSYAKKFNSDLIETDVILSRLFRSRTSGLHAAMSRMQKNYPDVYDYTMENFKLSVDSLLKKGKKHEYYLV